MKMIKKLFSKKKNEKEKPTKKIRKVLLCLMWCGILRDSLVQCLNEFVPMTLLIWLKSFFFSFIKFLGNCIALQMSASLGGNDKVALLWLKPHGF